MGIPTEYSRALTHHDQNDDLELYKKAFAEKPFRLGTLADEREFDFHWTITGSARDKRKLLNFFRKNVQPAYKYMDQRTNLAILYPNNHRGPMYDPLQELMNSYWQAPLCPFGLTRDSQEIIAFDLVSFEGDVEAETLLLAYEWLQVFIEKYFKKFNLKLSGYIDNSHRKYVVVDNVIFIHPSEHYASTIPDALACLQ